MTDTCQTIKISRAIEKIRASYSQNLGAVTSIKYYKGGFSKTYGTLLSTYKEWEFSDTVRLLGLHGRVSENTIVQIGFITLNTLQTNCE